MNWIFLPFLLFMLGSFASHSIAGDGLVLGVHPYKAASKIISSFSPLSDYLSRETAKSVSIKVSKDYQTHIDLLRQGEIDIAYLGPFSFIKVMQSKVEIELLAKQAVHGVSFFQGYIVVREDSHLKVLADLKGKRMAYGDENSTMSYILPRFMLHHAGVDDTQLGGSKFLGSHDNVALAVLTGDYDAGAVKGEVFQKYQHRGLKIIASTPQISEHLFVGRSSLGRNSLAKIRIALLKLKNDPEGLSIMEAIKPSITEFVPVSYADYENLVQIDHYLKHK